MPRAPLSRRVLLLSAALALVPVASCAGAKQGETVAAPAFTEGEREAIRLYWNAPNRYTVLPSDTPKRVNISVPGSLWYWNFVRLAPDPARTAWWAKRFAHEKARAFGTNPVPPNPGDYNGITPPPPLYETVTPTRYTVRFGENDAPFVYDDAIDFASRPAYYAYYRSTNGVRKAGQAVKDATGDDKTRLDTVFAKAGRTAFEQHVLAAVSRYEGGFAAINTYDTGFVSIGFIQFITAIDGTGSLSEVLSRYKTDNPLGFEGDFRRFGIDVAPGNVLVCVDPATGAEKRGTDAVRCVIDDKRLTAVFERAANFDGFRLAQVLVARSRYYPGDDWVTVGTFGTVRVGDIIKSEAGMATLMDRKVNKGNIRDFGDVCARMMTENALKSVAELSRYERALTKAMRYRGDFLSDATLTQPAPDPVVPAPAPNTKPTAPRKK